jgi:hypothetical protein
MALFNAGHRRHNLTWRTVAALETIMLNKTALDRVQFTRRVFQAFNCGHGFTLRLHGQCQTTQYPLLVYQHGTGTALPLIAPFLGTGQVEMIAQRI